MNRQGSVFQRRQSGLVEVDDRAGGQDKWKKRRLSWRITKFPSDTQTLSSREGKMLVERALKTAFQVWAEHADIEFVHKTGGDVDIEIRWEVVKHLDGHPFDGKGGYFSARLPPRKIPTRRRYPL